MPLRNSESPNIDRPIPQTYTRDALITRLLNENAYLKRNRPPFIVGEGVGRATPEDLSKREEYCFVRQFLRENVEESQPRARHLVIANEYPTATKRYANGFIHRRIKLYQQRGLDVDVVAFGKRVRKDVYRYDGVPVLAGYVNELVGLLSAYDYASISVHFMNSEMWLALKRLLPKNAPVAVFVHGYEARNWSRLHHDIRQVDTLNGRIERSFRHQDLWRELVDEHSGIGRFFFVSEWWRRAASEDLEVDFATHRSDVIHNVIDTDLFNYVEKDPEQRFNILWVRSAHARNYGADIAAKVVRGLKQTPYWERIKVTIIGDGAYFDEFDEFLSDTNVDVRRGFVAQEEIAELHKEHGIFLVPSRFDTQGVSRDEAMSSGLVPVTNPVTAIPEFVDDSCAVQFAEYDVAAAVAGIIELFEVPEKFLAMSRAAMTRVQRQCGPASTVRREIAYLTGQV